MAESAELVQQLLAALPPDDASTLSSLGAAGFQYIQNGLLDYGVDARRAYETLLTAFAPTMTAQDITDLQEAEQRAREVRQRLFLAQEEEALRIEEEEQALELARQASLSSAASRPEMSDQASAMLLSLQQAAAAQAAAGTAPAPAPVATAAPAAPTFAAPQATFGMTSLLSGPATAFASIAPVPGAGLPFALQNAPVYPATMTPQRRPLAVPAAEITQTLGSPGLLPPPVDLRRVLPAAAAALLQSPQTGLPLAPALPPASTRIGGATQTAPPARSLTPSLTPGMYSKTEFANSSAYIHDILGDGVAVPKANVSLAGRKRKYDELTTISNVIDQSDIDALLIMDDNDYANEASWLGAGDVGLKANLRIHTLKFSAFSAPPFMKAIPEADVAATANGTISPGDLNSGTRLTCTQPNRTPAFADAGTQSPTGLLKTIFPALVASIEVDYLCTFSALKGELGSMANSLTDQAIAMTYFARSWCYVTNCFKRGSALDINVLEKAQFDAICADVSTSSLPAGFEKISKACLKEPTMLRRMQYGIVMKVINHLGSGHTTRGPVLPRPQLSAAEKLFGLTAPPSLDEAGRTSWNKFLTTLFYVAFHTFDSATVGSMCLPSLHLPKTYNSYILMAILKLDDYLKVRTEFLPRGTAIAVLAHSFIILSIMNKDIIFIRDIGLIQGVCTEWLYCYTHRFATSVDASYLGFAVRLTPSFPNSTKMLSFLKSYHEVTQRAPTLYASPRISGPNAQIAGAPDWYSGVLAQAVKAADTNALLAAYKLATGVSGSADMRLLASLARQPVSDTTIITIDSTTSKMSIMDKSSRSSVEIVAVEEDKYDEALEQISKEATAATNVTVAAKKPAIIATA